MGAVKRMSCKAVMSNLRYVGDLPALPCVQLHRYEERFPSYVVRPATSLDHKDCNE